MIPIFIHPSESFDRPSKPVPANGAPLSVLILEGIPYSRIAASQTALTNLTQVHSRDDLTADQITTVGVGDRERIATRAITRGEVPLKIHAPELIGGCHLREGLRVWRRASLFALWARKASSLKDVAEGTGHWPLHARIQLL